MDRLFKDSNYKKTIDLNDMWDFCIDPDDKGIEEKWFEKQGPVSSECIEFIRSNADKYDIFIFVTYLYYLTVKGLPEVSEKAVLIPTAHEEPYIHFKFYEDFFKKPAGFIFLTDEEKELV